MLTMPRYPVTTFLNKKQHSKLEIARKKLKLSRYKFFQKAIMAYCKAVEKEKIKIDGEKGQNGETTVRSESETRRQRPLAVRY